MNRLLILGAGGHGWVVADAASETRTWDELAFLDDQYGKTDAALPWPVIGRFVDKEALNEQYKHAIVAVGNNRLRMKLIDDLLGASTPFDVPIVIHPNATVSRSAKVGVGTVVMANAVVNPGAVLGRGCIVNTSATVEHECILKDGVHVCPGARIAGQVNIGKGSWIGIGSCVCEGVHVGEGVTVGAGAVVLDDVLDHVTVVGVPARELRSARE